MTRPRRLASALLVLPAALLCMAATPPPTKAPQARPAPAKAAAAKPAAKPAAAPSAAATKPAAPPASGPFDATNPQGIMDLLSTAGAKVQTSQREGDSVFVRVTSAAASFSMQFAGCSPQGRACRAVLLDRALARGPLTGAQVNAFNQTSVMCRIYQAPGGETHVVYSAILFRSMTRDDADTHLLAWQGCLADSADFLKDPAGYLANAA